jgi:tRNA pseudouridine13 synthase
MKIKQIPEDFIVEEISIVKPKKTGEYTYFEVKKTNWTTQRAIQQITRRLRVSKRRIGFAGNKDKHAITTQTCSIWEIEPELIERINIKDIEIKVLGKGDERINLGDLKTNKFKIKINDVSEKELTIFNKNFPEIKKNGFLNLFGVQRFGSAGNSDKIGNEIVNGNLKHAVKLFISEHGDNEEATKFGKYVLRHWGDWKKVINECPKFLGLEAAVINWLIRIPTDFGGALRQIPKPTLRIMVSAYQSRIWNKTVLKAEKLPKVLEIPALEIKRMPELSMCGTERKTIIKPKNLKHKVDGNTILLDFELTPGSYATVLIDALFNS